MVLRYTAADVFQRPPSSWPRFAWPGGDMSAASAGVAQSGGDAVDGEQQRSGEERILLAGPLSGQ